MQSINSRVAKRFGILMQWLPSVDLAVDARERKKESGCARGRSQNILCSMILPDCQMRSLAKLPYHYDFTCFNISVINLANPEWFSILDVATRACEEQRFNETKHENEICGAINYLASEAPYLIFTSHLFTLTRFPFDRLVCSEKVEP